MYFNANFPPYAEDVLCGAAVKISLFSKLYTFFEYEWIIPENEPAFTVIIYP